MSLFNCLPIVNNGCYCFTLKVASIMIAMYGIISLGWSTYYITRRGVCPPGSLEDLIKYAKIILIAGDFTVMFGSIIFLIGVFIRRRVTAEIFLVTIAVMIFAYLFYSIVGIHVSSKDRKCQNAGYPISILMRVFVWMYFMVIIRSFKEEME